MNCRLTVGIFRYHDSNLIKSLLSVRENDFLGVLRTFLSLFLSNVLVDPSTEGYGGRGEKETSTLAQRRASLDRIYTIKFIYSRQCNNSSNRRSSVSFFFP